MKYLRYNEARETLIDKKMIFLEDITADMRDSGMDVKIFNGSDNSLIGTLRMHLAARISTGPTSKYIYVVVMRNGSKVVGSTVVSTSLCRKLQSLFFDQNDLPTYSYQILHFVQYLEVVNID